MVLNPLKRSALLVDLDVPSVIGSGGISDTIVAAGSPFACANVFGEWFMSLASASGNRGFYWSDSTHMIMNTVVCM